MSVFGLAARWTHLACGLALVGIFDATLLAGRSDRPTARAWAALTLRIARGLALATLLSGVATLLYQLAVASGRAGAMFEPAIWLRLLFHTQWGVVWLLRHGVLALLAALLVLREREESAADWTAWRVEALALAAVAAAASAWAGHAIGAEPLHPIAVLADVLHLLAAGCWLGALLPLALLLHAASLESGADARAYAVLVVRRFSPFAAVAMLLIAATGVWNAWTQVGSVAALVGTRYGRLLLVKVVLLVPILAFAFANRRRLLPALSGDGATVGRPAMARLSRFVACELALALLVVFMAAALSLSVPGAHDVAWWPFSYRLSYEAAVGRPGIDGRVLIGGQLAFLGLLASLIAWLSKRWRGVLAALGGLGFLSGAWMALVPLAVEAHPTTYRRSPVPYEAGSIAEGAALYETHCATCHGWAGKSDGPGSARLSRRPADLAGPRAAALTAGDLFWQVTHGIRASGMPAFAETLSEDERWDLINFLRALASGAEARALTPIVDRDRPRVIAPDFSYAVGPTPRRTLKEFRGRSTVLVVLFSLPESRHRIDQLAAAYEAINVSGAEVVAVPMDADPSIIRRLGASPPILFPVVTEGAAEIVRAYSLFAGTPDSPPPRHAEFLVDRRGYLRARWIPGRRSPGWEDLSILGAQIRVLDRETPVGRAADDHVH